MTETDSTTSTGGSATSVSCDRRRLRGDGSLVALLRHRSTAAVLFFRRVFGCRLAGRETARMKDRENAADAEGAVRTAWENGQESAAVSAALKLYGAEIYGLLVGLCRGPHEADDAFSLFAEGLWQSLATFEWKCSLRTWAYVIARRSAHDLRRKARRPQVGLSQVDEISAMVARVRTETAPFQKTEVKNRMAELRATLPEDDQILLILRLDRELAWEDLARVFAGDHAAPDALKRESARLRKRFQLVKERLVELGRREGLFDR